MTARQLSVDDINETALKHFIYQPVNNKMIAYLAHTAERVISCEPSVQSRSEIRPSSTTLEYESDEDNSLPTVEEFIRQLVVSSKVQVATLMASLVYLNRLRSRLQPQAHGIRCTAHRIFLASLILSAKYLNDSSPKNKHWANYTKFSTTYYQFGFPRTEVNAMERQLLFLLEWDLTIHEDDLYRELYDFLEPLRQKITNCHIRGTQDREKKRRQDEMKAAARRHPSAAPSHDQSRSRKSSSEYSSSGSTPSLVYSSSASSCASSVSSHYHHPSVMTPFEQPDAHMFMAARGGLCESLWQIHMDDSFKHSKTDSDVDPPCKILHEEYYQLHDNFSKKHTRQGVLRRWFVNAAAR